MSQCGIGASEEMGQNTKLNEQAMVDTSCLVCGGTHCETVASIGEIAEQNTMLKIFHQQRRRKDAQADLRDRTSFSQDYATEVVRCLTCGCIYQKPRPTLRAVTTQYAEDEYGAELHKSEFQAQEAWPEGNNTAFAQRCGFSTSAPVVVEVGSFVDGFLAAAQRKGWAILGLDPGKEVVNFCHAQGLPVIHGTLKRPPLHLNQLMPSSFGIPLINW